jgi:RNA polymerase sigma-70 factor (ECF subfamily)
MGSDEQSHDDAPSEARLYCVVSAELARRLHEPLRRHFRDDPTIEVVVERRASERRQGDERRVAVSERTGAERRRIGMPGGRRVGERRATLVEVGAPQLPRRFQRHAAGIVFVERLAPSTLDAEDADTARLVTRIQAGEKDLYAELYQRYFTRVYGYVRVALNDTHEAEDVTQQVFMQVLEALPRFRLGSQPVRAWLFTITRNVTVSQLRRSGRSEATEPRKIDERRERDADPNGDALPLSTLEWISDRDLVMLVERLPDPQRQVLALRYLLDLRVSEVAEVLGRTPNDVSQLQHRALKFLQARLRSLGRLPRGGTPIRIRRRIHQAPVLRMRRFALLP